MKPIVVRNRDEPVWNGDCMKTRLCGMETTRRQGCVEWGLHEN